MPVLFRNRRGNGTGTLNFARDSAIPLGNTSEPEVVERKH
jgi:hypothetical protein